jgi:hypothetical protein
MVVAVLEAAVAPAVAGASGGGGGDRGSGGTSSSSGIVAGFWRAEFLVHVECKVLFLNRD